MDWRTLRMLSIAALWLLPALACGAESGAPAETASPEEPDPVTQASSMVETESAAIPARPNVILAFSDQHRWQAMSFTETPELHTPELERLAAEGFQAANFVSNYPLCSPARAIVMSGRWPFQTGVIDNSTKDYSVLGPEEITLGKVFSRAGYDTAYIGKWHLGREPKTLEPFGFGHSVIWSRTNNHWNSNFVEDGGAKQTSRRYNGTHMTEQLLEFIERPRGGPFFAVVSWNLPHSNYVDAPDALRMLYPHEGVLPNRANWALAPDVNVQEAGGSHYRGYHAHVTAVDSELGRIRRRLSELGISDNTIVIYTSDHGAMLRSHAIFGKRVPFAESIRVPFLAVWPGTIPAGRTDRAPYGLIDLMPTLCGLAGLEIPPDRSGKDFSKVILGGELPPPESQFLMNIASLHPRDSGEPEPPAEFYRGIATDRYTYAVTAEKPWLLFDNQADPLQLRNLIEDPNYAQVRQKLHGFLLQWLKRAEDPFELPTSL